MLKILLGWAPNCRSTSLRFVHFRIPLLTLRGSWESAIYTVDDLAAPLHLTTNKGREANAYLTYIIQHYDSLPNTIVFLHSHKEGWPEAWHTDEKNYNNVLSVQKLRLDTVQNNGYVNLR